MVLVAPADVARSELARECFSRRRRGRSNASSLNGSRPVRPYRAPLNVFLIAMKHDDAERCDPEKPDRIFCC
jgi:hypothetical protein